MPLESIERETGESEEVVLTPEDRSRLDILFQEIGTDSLFAINNRQQLAWRRKLREEGSKAATYIFERIATEDVSQHSYGNQQTPSLYDCVSWLDFCATPNEAQKLGEFLLDNKISLDGDRSNKNRLLTLLARIGIVENIDQLIAYSEKVFGNNYESSLMYYDNYDTMRALTAISKRTTDPTEQEKIKLAQNSINRNLVNHDLEPIPESRAASMDVEPRILARDFENLFRDRDFFLDEYNLAHRPWHEETIDSQIEEDYSENKFEEAESRLETVKRLRHEAQKEKNIKEDPEEDDTKFLRRHFLEYREENPSPYAPTLGIEIEIRERSLNLPKDEKCYYDTTEIRKKFRRTQELGVPSRYDAFWEFAHKPVKYYHTLSREVQALIEMALINKDYKKHALHLTIGGVSSKMAGGEGSFILARALEATGWSTTGGRLMRPYLVKQSVWSGKGRAGIKERLSLELGLGVNKGIEIRTFQLQSLAGLDRLLRGAFLLGAALKSFQKIKGGDEESIKSKEQLELVSVWQDFAVKCKSIFAKFGLSSPDYAWKAPEPMYMNDETKCEFVPFAKLLDEAKQNPQSDGAKFVSEMRKLVIETRAKIAKIIYPKENDQET